MPKIPTKSEFEPDKDALSQWLSTRKVTLNVNGLSIPGLFNDHRFDVDQNWAMVAIIGEIIGMVLTIYGGADIGGVFLIISILVVIGLLFIDILCAIKLHRNKGRKCWIENYIYLYGEKEPQQRKDYELEMNNWNSLDFLFITLIVLVIIIKIGAIVALGVFSNIFIYIPILIIYIIVGYVHVYHTGYWIAYMKTSNMFRKQYDSSKINIQERSFPFSTQHKLSNVPIERAMHKVVKDEGDMEESDKEEEKYKYKLLTKGILTDEDLEDIFDGQQEFQKLELVKACRRFQFSRL